MPERIETGVVLLVVLFITYVLLLFSDAFLHVIGRGGHSRRYNKKWCSKRTHRFNMIAGYEQDSSPLS